MVREVQEDLRRILTLQRGLEECPWSVSEVERHQIGAEVAIFGIFLQDYLIFYENDYHELDLKLYNLRKQRVQQQVVQYTGVLKTRFNK